MNGVPNVCEEKNVILSNLTQLSEKVTCQILSVAEVTGWLNLLPKFDKIV